MYKNDNSFNRMCDVVIVTEKSLMDRDADLKSAIAFEEDNLLMEAFLRKSISCRRAAWDDENFDWSATRSAVIRSTWNYSSNIDSFKNWLDTASEKCCLINNKELVMWNLDKKYLFDLNSVGVEIPRTHIIERDKHFDPAAWNKKLKANGIVVKPTVSAGARDTYLFKEPFSTDNLEIVEDAILNQEMIVQPFMESIVTCGEISMVFINGKYIHSMIKTPGSNDFRVQEYHGGSLNDYEPNNKELEFGERVLEACRKIKGDPVYARIDYCYDNDGNMLLMELEAIEPQLWFPNSAAAVDNFVEGVINTLEY